MTNVIERIAKNVLFIILSKVVIYPIGFVVEVCLARHLGIASYGKYTFALSFIAIFGVLSDFGLGTVATRATAINKERAHVYLGTSLIVRLFLGVISFGLSILCINILGYPKETALIAYTVGFSLLFSTLDAGFNSIFNGLERMEYSSMVLVAWKVINGGVLLLFVLAGGGIVAISSSAAISAAFGLIVCIWIYERVLKGKKPFFDVRTAKFLLNESFPLFLSSFVLIVNLRVSNVFISKIKGDIDLGLYNSADIIAKVLLVAPSTVVAALFPSMGRLYNTAVSSLTRAYATTAKYLFTAAVPIAVLGGILSSEIMVFLFGKRYFQAGEVLKILIIQTFFIYLTDLHGNTLVAIGKQKIVFYVICVCAIVNIGFNAILVPRYGAPGAAMAATIAESVPFVIHPAIVHRYLSYSIRKAVVMALKMLICGMAMTIPIFSFPNTHVLIKAVTGIGIYGISLFVVRAFGKDDLAFMKTIYRGIKSENRV